ncbi:hypothetical protein [Pandoraea sputorum]|uniref:Uncharacterized protein n=1 Tax=Pandoraea sputorum TaxID=93222 RepID=A0A239T0T3_9BURK|nr:hypothetical protein [Pandoraea sputorum]SNU90708.1 Uncharacterised protein [Pandoraea sputorum]VVD76272.1 hypothetical protein PSP20601_00880 [Pandoraea sputorum]VVE80303.1 hypothetical protein PSP31120_02533 [Pandoraea sputorum]
MPEISNQYPPPHQYPSCSLPGTARATAAAIARRGLLSYRNSQLQAQMAYVRQLRASQDNALQLLNRLEARAEQLMNQGASSHAQSPRPTSCATFRAEIKRCQAALAADPDGNGCTGSPNTPPALCPTRRILMETSNVMPADPDLTRTM